MSRLLDPLARARGHGSAGHGTSHWLAQRATSVLLALLLPWLMTALALLPDHGFAATATFIARPWNATLLILLLATLAYHAVLGLQVVIEDYVHHRALELTLQLLVRAAGALAAISGVLHVLRIALGA